MHQALRKISSPDSQPFADWNRQWQILHLAWLAARQEVEKVSSSFRPVPEQKTLADAREVERIAFEAMQRFWEEEETGNHL
jgi:hypothetical protein